MDQALFLSPDGFSPRHWGKMLWLIMTIVAANFPLVPTEDQSMAYFRFYDGLRHVLPCKSCRVEYCKMICQGPPTLRLRKKTFVQGASEPPGAARQRVFAWVVRIHSHVNRRLGKKRRSSVHFWAREYAKLRTPGSNVSRLPSGDL